MTLFLGAMKILKYLKLLKYVLRKADQELRSVEMRSRNWPEVRFQKNVQIKGSAENISIAQGAQINSDVYLNSGGESYGGDGKIVIGSKAIVGAKTTLFAGGGVIEIGKNCDIGVGVLILSHSAISSRENSKEFSHTRISIADNVYISSGAIILGETSIGENCTVTSGAVVQGNFKKNFLITGNPAKAFPKH